MLTSSLPRIFDEKTEEQSFSSVPAVHPRRREGSRSAMSSDEEVVVCKGESPAVVVCIGFGLMASITTRFGEVPAMLFGSKVRPKSKNLYSSTKFTLHPLHP